MTSPYAFGTETFSKQTLARGIMKGAAISEIKLDNYTRYLTKYVRYLINYIL